MLQRSYDGGMNPPHTRAPIQVVEYNPEWAGQFRQLSDRIWPFVRDVALEIEHVGSTAVPGLAAKPVIDLDVVIASLRDVPLIVARLAQQGYEHQGNLAIEDREAFQAPENQPPHHLYVCSRQSMALRNHLVLRDHLRAHPADVAAYSRLKKQLALQCGSDIGRYVAGKTGFILSILAQYEFPPACLESIRQANQK